MTLKIKGKPPKARANERRKASRKAPGYKSRKGVKLVEGLNKSQLVEKYAQKVKFIAQGIHQKLSPNVDVEDLISVGFIGLMDAADKFDDSRGYQFITYASFRIRGAILDELRSRDFMPRSLRHKAKEIEKTTNELFQKLGRKPNEKELGKALGLSQDEMADLRMVIGDMSLQSVDDFSILSSDDQKAIRESIFVEHEEDPSQIAQKNEVRSMMERLFGLFPEREKMILSLYYFRGLNQREIGDILELSDSRVCQLHNQSILKIKEAIGSKQNSSMDHIFQALLAS